MLDSNGRTKGLRRQIVIANIQATLLIPFCAAWCQQLSGTGNRAVWVSRLIKERRTVALPSRMVPRGKPPAVFRA